MAAPTIELAQANDNDFRARLFSSHLESPSVESGPLNFQRIHMEEMEIELQHDPLIPEALNTEQLEQVKSFLKEAIFELELENDELVLSVSHQPEGMEGTSYSLGEPLAYVGLRTVVGAFVGRRIDNSLDQQSARAELLAMAGRLREAARFIEKHAEPLNEEEWGMSVVPQLYLIEYEEEGESDSAESENGVEPER